MYSQKKRQNNYYGHKQQNKKKRNFVLEPGLKGFLCTCNFREKDCVKEAYNVLNEYADQLYGNKSKETKERVEPPTEEQSSKEACSKDEEDIDDALSKELNNLKEDWRKPQKFQVVDSGANNCLFIKTTLEDPVELAHSIMKDVYETKKQKTRFLLRLIPIEATCKAYMDEIQKCAATLFDKYFSKEGKTFAVVFNYRNNSSVSRTTIIEEFAEMIKMRNVDNKVDLSQPELTVIVEVIRSMCCLSVVPEYFKLLKYNLLELCDKGEKAKIAKAKADETKEPEGKSGKTEEEKTMEGEAEETPKTDGLENSKPDGETNLKTDGEENPKADGEGKPKADGEENPKADGEENPKTDGEETPKTDEENPKADGEENPKTDGEETPKTDEENPKTDCEQNPKTDCEEGESKENTKNAEGDMIISQPSDEMSATKKQEKAVELKQDTPAETKTEHNKTPQDIGNLAAGEPAE